MERRLAAILAGDVVGYSRMMAEDENGTFSSLRSGLDEVVLPIAEMHGGRVFKTTGDGFMATFPSVAEALDAALKIQDGYADRPLELRLGLNLGDVIEEDGDVFGDEVNIAARLEAMAEPGSLYVSAAVVRGAARHSGITFHPLGLRRAKNLPTAIEVYEARRGERRKRWLPRWPVAAAAALAGVVVVGGGWALRDGAFAELTARLLGTEEVAPAPSDARPSVAVLPFDNLSRDPTQDYFTDGLTEDIITDLAQYGELMVIARNSTFAFKDMPTDLREVGARLGARYIVEGSARRADDQLRVVAQLIDASNGTHLWSRSYDRRYEDVFAVQSELTAEIVASLVSYVRQSASATISDRPTEDLRAYDVVLRGRERLEMSKTNGGALLEARALFTRALELDPDYALPRAYLALTHISDSLSDITGQATEKDLETGLAQAREAIRLEPDLAVGYQVLSYGLAGTGDYEGGMRAAERAVELNPSDPDSLMALAKAQTRFGASAEAVGNAERARQLHPMAPEYYPYVHAQALYGAGRYQEALEVVAECLLRAPNDRNCLRIQSVVLVRLGDVERARSAMQRLAGLEPSFSIELERTAKRFGDSPLMADFLDDLATAGAPMTAGQAQRTRNPGDAV